ncbi:MAG: sensor domain-containing diguanylate cyclase, partial [Lapillicoccus sp.]
DHTWRFGPWARLVFLGVSLLAVFGAARFGNGDDAVVQVTIVVLLAVVLTRFGFLVRDTEYAHRQAKASEARFRLLATAAPVGIYEVNPSLQIVFANDESELIIGGTMVGMVDDGFRLLAVDTEDRELFQAAVTTVLGGRRASAQFRIRGSDGTQRWVAWFGTPAHPGEGPFAGAFVSTIDITALKDAEALLALQATHDPLTHLPNRRLLYDRISGAVTRLDRRPGLLAVLFFDLDRFKQVNDRLGHDAGDELLTIVASRLLETVRSQDTVGRYGGDEFVVVLEDISDRFHAALVAQKIIAAISAPIVINGSLCDVSASIGIALTADPHEDPDVLLRTADTAMYYAKRTNPGRFHFADETPSPDPPGPDTALPPQPTELRNRALTRSAAEQGDR